jgi:hypothetical protein
VCVCVCDSECLGVGVILHVTKTDWTNAFQWIRSGSHAIQQASRAN